MKTASLMQATIPEPSVEHSLSDAKAQIRANREPAPLAKSGSGKPRVLILPNVASWIVGQMAMHVMERFKDKYEFWILTDKMLRLRPDLVKALIPGLDFIFPLTDKSYKLLRKAAGPLPLPPSIFWLHHVTSWNPSMLAAANDAHELIACTPEWKTEIEKQCPGPAITVVPHGVDADFFHKVPRRRARFGMPENGFVVGFIGNKTSNYDEGRKGLDTLEIVMRDLRKYVPNLHVCFLGLGWNEEVRQFQQQGVSANYTGFIPQSLLPAFYSSIDVHIVSSRIEGGPVTVLEAMACETAVVTTRVGLVPHTIVDGKNGFSAEIGDIEALVRALRELAASPHLLKSIGTAARADAYPHRSWGKVLDALEEPLARMEARSNRPTTGSSSASAKTAAQLAGAVHTMDGLLWGIMSWWEGLLSPQVAGRMVKACWEGYGAADVLRGIGLVTRSSFRPASLQRNRLTSENKVQGGPMEASVLSEAEAVSCPMTDGQLVSVVIINYNYGRYLKQCIESVLTQDYQPMEVIVVDDGSTDDSRAVIESYSGRLTPSFKQNGGMVTAMNHGFGLSHGLIVIFVDADDYLFPGAVAAHVRALSEPGVVRSQTYMTVLHGSDPSNKRIPGPRAGEGNLRELTLERGPGAYVSSPNSGNAWSRGFLKEVFPLPERPRTIGAETFLMDAAPLFGKVSTLGEIKAAYRLHGVNMSGQVGMTLENIQKILGHIETRTARLAETAASLGYDASAADWCASNWRFLTLDYLRIRLSRTGQSPGFIKHLKSAFKVRNPLKRAVVASVILGIRTMPAELSLWLASRVIQLRYM